MTICTRSVALTKLKRGRRGLNAFPGKAQQDPAMPSLAETHAAQRRMRGRFMAMAAIIQTEQPDSLVLLPPGSAGETRAVGERWPARARVCGRAIHGRRAG
jgi:hypothetical protein